MKKLFLLLAVLLACGQFSCMYRGSYYEPVSEKDAAISPQPEERVEEIESTEKIILGPWHEKFK